MSFTPMSSLGRGLRRLWWLLDASRRALLNLLLLALIGALLWAWLRPGPGPLQPQTTLVLQLNGPVKEQRAGDPRSSALKRLQGDDDAGQTRLRDLLAVLDAAAKDPNIAQALLMLDDFQGAGLPTLREIGAALERFKASGKPVVAWGAGYDQRQYFVAAHATTIWLDPMGAVLPQGFGGYRTYYKDAFDRFGIEARLIRVGKFKSAGEPFVANGPSPEALAADQLLYDALWADWTSSVERARTLPAGHVQALINSLPEALSAAGGDAAQLVLRSKLVDGLKTRDEMRQQMITRGIIDTSGGPGAKTFRQIGFNAYLARLTPKTSGDAVGVVVAEGEIGDGEAPAGRIGGLSTAALIRQARDDDQIKAVVLRVDSPGGSAYGSELVRRELALTRAAGKPVVVSMGDLAASGGYWISTSADEVIADPATITGSIGVFALLPNAQGALDKLGVHSGGYTTTWLTGAGDARRTLDPRMAALIQTSVDRIYRDFTDLAAAARKTTPEKIDAVAQGRVWTGTQALERGLIDRTGSYSDALASALKRAKLPADARISYLERPPGRLAQLMAFLGVRGDGLLARTLLATWPAGADGLLGPAGGVMAGALPPGVSGPLLDDLGWLAELARQPGPFNAQVHCLCTAP